MADPEFRRFKKLLTSKGYFMTKPRMRLFGLLQKHPALTFKQLLTLNHQHDPVTLYRNIELFESLGIINKLRLGWETKIELSDVFQHHHHHFTCVTCGRIITLKENIIIENQIKNLTKQLSLKATDHQLEIRGICPTCQRKG